MFISQLIIDVGDNPDRPRPARLWLRDIYRVHQRLSMAFPSDEQKRCDADNLQPFKPDGYTQNNAHRNPQRGFLFRIDPIMGRNPVVVVQSAIKPDWGYAFHNAGDFLAADPQTQALQTDFNKGQRLRFRLLANPTKRDKESGRRLPADSFDDWLQSRSTKNGFALDADALQMQLGYVSLFKPKWRREPEQKRAIRLRSVRYEGILTVQQPDDFKDALIGGFGTAKGFGFGLMSVQPIS